MTKAPSTARRTDPRLPYLRAVARELKERAIALADLETRRGDLIAGRDVDVDALRLVEADLLAQRRELRRIQAELDAIECEFDIDHPFRVRVQARGGGGVAEPLVACLRIIDPIPLDPARRPA